MSWKRTLFLAAIVIPLAMAARWNGSVKPKGARFHPWPDAVEYAAQGQALARSGQVFLQIGPHRVRPRYPPGWPLMLALAVRLGVEGQNLWRVTALFGAALAWLLAVVAAKMTEMLAGREGDRAGPASLVAGLLAGLLWALAPIAVDVGQAVMSDEPAALAACAGLVFSGVAFLRTAGRGWVVLAVLGGLAFGLAASMRTVVAALLVPPLAVLLLGGLRRLGGSATLRRLVPWVLGAAVFPALTILIQIHSGWPAWEWSGYGFWIPGRYDHLTDTFSLRHAFTPDLAFRQEVHGRPISHLELAVRVLLGLPGLRVYQIPGLLWPLAGWLAAIPLWRAAKRCGARTAPWIAAALLAWVLGHVAVFSLYFYPSARFYLAPVAVCAVLFAAGCGLFLSRPKPGVRLGAGLAATLALLLTAWSFAALRTQVSPDLRRGRTRAMFNRWLALGDERRAGRTMPFDPVHAQALGLLTPEVAAGIRTWGELPDTVHVRRLRGLGFLPKPVPGPRDRSGRLPLSSSAGEGPGEGSRAGASGRGYNPHRRHP